MANKVTIDVEARFIDNMSDDAKAAAKSFDGIETAAKDAQKEVTNLGKKKAKPKVDADDSAFIKKMNKSDRLLRKFGRSKSDTKLGAVDKATAVINKALNKAKAFGNKTYSALVKIRDSGALNTLNKISNAGKSIAGKTWTAVVKIKNLTTAPFRAIKNSLFNIKNLIAGIAAAWATNQFVINPIQIADQYSSAKISFSTLLGESQGQKMMDDLDDFAKKTPFNTSNVIGNAQKMLAMGWDAENIIEDMEIIGNAAASTGKLDQGLESIVRALSQIKTKGRLSTEELNQLAEAGIAAKAMLAENLGYGTGDAGIAKMTEDLEDGAIASDKAIQALLAGMKKYDGMMDSMANETAEGLWSQIQDTFQINIFRKWGQGLQDGAKRGFGAIVDLLDEADGALEKFGETIYEVGKNVSNWLADKFENAIRRITKITDSYEFKEASLGKKISMLWNGVIVDPLKEWWENGGQEKTAETAGKIGGWIGEMLTKGLLALFGATDILDEGVGKDQGASVAGSFLQGFLDNFDGSAITDAFVDAISNVWGALPWWGKMLIGGYGVGKAAGGIANFAGGILNFAGGAKNLIGGFNIASSLFPHLTSSGSGILGAIGKVGVATGATTTGGALLAGGGSIAGGLTAGIGLIHAGKTGWQAYQDYKAGDKTSAKANLARSGGTLAGIGAGAAIGAKAGTAIGALFGGVGAVPGALIGAGIGTVVGWLGGDKLARKIEAAKYETEEMQAAMKDADVTAEELAATFDKAVYNKLKDNFGDIKLTLSEIQSLTSDLVWGEDLGHFEKYTASVQAAETALQNLKTYSDQTERWMWKASLGVKFDEDEIESIKQSFDSYINAAKSFVENKHYEFTAAVSLLVDVESEEGKSIIDSGNAYFSKIQEQLDDLGSKLSKKVEIALEDGVITLNEEKEIINLQQQIASITEKLANAEQKAELELIKLKFGNGNLDLESFETFMATMQETISERLAADDKAFIASVSQLNLQLEDGSITQEQYDKQLQTLVDGYTGNIEKLKAEVKDIELEIIGDAYEEELGKNAKEKLEKALNESLKTGIDPVEWTDEELSKLLGVDDLGPETAAGIKQMLSGVLDQIELLQVDGKVSATWTVESEEDPEEKIKETLPETVESTVGVNISGEKNIQETIDILTSDFGIPPEHAATIALLLTGDKEILNQIDVSALAKEFGIPESQAQTIVEKLTGEKHIENRINVLASDFGIGESISHTLKVNITAIKGKLTNLVGDLTTNTGSKNKTPKSNNPRLRGLGYGKKFRGGYVGAPSALEAYARGGRPVDGMLDGSTKIISVNEENPEMIIPLGIQRRDRALKLWEKTGELLKAPGFARGGRTTGDQDEGFRFQQYGSDRTSDSSSTHIEVGGVKVEIHVDASNGQSVTEAIKEQANEIAETVAGVLADAFAAQFENTPVRGGV